MTHDAAVNQIREGLLFVESELEARGDKKALKAVRLYHAKLKKIADQYVQAGNISALSVGGDKPEGP